MSSTTATPHVVILAGGQGSRFWPLSRLRKPKPFLSISESKESLIQATARRARHLLRSNADLWIVTNDLQRELTAEHVPEARLITEPMMRNTAPAIGLAAIHLRAACPDAVMVMLPADHAVMAEDKLIAVLQEAVDLAASEPVLVTVGIQPTTPNTAYGYIKRGVSLRGNAYMVHRFFEKPNQERANSYYESGQFVWNSGMFVARVDTIMNAFEEHMPPLYDALERIAAVIGTPQETVIVEEEFQALESVSIDFGVLEHARNCAVVCADQFGWNDVGAWDAWADHFAHDSRDNLCLGDVLAIDSRNCVIRSEHKLTAVVGASDLVVIDSGDALLVCPKSRVQDVKLIVEELKKRGRSDLL